MRVSILDQVPITEHTPTPAEAVTSGLRLAQEAEALGYHRIWFAEHHRSASFASTAPEMMTALALERTRRIRVGTGGILLPLYPVQKIIEVMSLLGQVHGDRIDTGVGRAALDDPDYGEKIAALAHALGTQHPSRDGEPDGRVWVLGAGGSASPLAGLAGAGYAHGHFFVPRGGETAMSAYRATTAEHGHGAHTVLAVRVVTAETRERAQELADATLLWRARKDLGFVGPIPSAETTLRHEWTDAEHTRAKARSQAIITGTPDQVSTELTALAEAHNTDEVMINTLTSDPNDRLTSYRMLAERLME
ncbi:LLM class flavin-dependent oxidoreductase [Natronoglycomyces albus]|uniref:LLM class flavin-dependent oxidoreductase n=1 Tax=Natronoglycomyces albus TaxID=2811108 RepID=A0A895XR78_9ACTN|nr:LLM class flavin-dependent oxidoreductase [Natronoglycomyces albus]QSB04098.1 LLM class flavin-dependent oxidoreductase [Natronoglycomyces albus]